MLEYVTRRLRGLHTQAWCAFVRHNLTTILTVTVVGSAMFVWIAHRFGSWNALAARVRGETLLVHPRVRHIGNLQPNSETAIEFQIQNVTDEPVMVVGLSGSCSCAAATELPMVIRAGAQMPLVLRVRAGTSGAGGTKLVSITLHLNRPGPKTSLGVQWDEPWTAVPVEPPLPTPMARLND
jgi:hypothetical protein